jgi:hypothetical protein
MTLLLSSYLDIYSFYWCLQAWTCSDTKRKGGTQLIKYPGSTPISNRTQTSGVPLFYSRPLISSQSWVLIRKLRTFILHLRELRRLSAFRPQIDLPLTRQHTELGPFRPGTHGTQMLDIATDQFPSAKH